MDPLDLVELYGDYYDVSTTPMPRPRKAKTWFVIAALRGDLEKMKELRDDVDDINEHIYIGVRFPPTWNALESAIIGNHPTVVSYLIAEGADLNQKIRLHTDLGFRYLWGIQLPQFILDVQRNDKLRDEALTPLQLAQKLGYQDIVALLQNPDKAKNEEKYNAPVKEPSGPSKQKALKISSQENESLLKNYLHQLENMLKELEVALLF